MIEHRLNSQTAQAAALLRNKKTALAEDATARVYKENLETWSTYGDRGREKGLRDMGYHLNYLIEALEAADPTLFIEYISWAKVLFASLDLPDQALSRTMDSMQAALEEALPEELWQAVQPYMKAGMHQLEIAPSKLPSFLKAGDPLVDLAQAYFDTLLAGQRRVASRLIMDAVQEEVSIRDIYLHVFQPVQREVGRLWQQNQVSVAQEHYCTAATQLIMSQLYPKIFSTAKTGRRLVATCVGGELHEIGVRMVADFFEMEGWDTYYLGANTPAESILQTITEQSADVLAISATLMFHVSKVSALIQQVREIYNQETLKILVGGYPFNTAPGLWRQVGADSYAADAQQAIAIANQMVEGSAGHEGT
jgi:methanogenic corrinoid protein MtbC1